MRVIRLTFLVTVKLLNYNAALCKQCYSTQSNVRVRFAPSPTGLLHLGGLRTALYNYLFAKSKGGTFILRIEDTDQNRLVPGAVEQLQSDLKWVGIVPDEGPYRQSERLDLYKKEALNLIENGHAYYCFCTERRLSLLRKEALKLRQVPKYDNKCRHLSKEEVQTKLNNNEQSCIRFKLSSGGQTFDDVVYGPVTHDVASLEGDPVIFKTDGFPTYHLANVVDDHYMNISHVLRGVEWQSSTAKHILLYKAFGWNPPYFAHLPLLVNPDGTKFSKRQGAITVQSYRNEGIYPRALVNFVTFTGGLSNLEGEPHKPRTFNIGEIIKLFNLSYVGKQPCRLMFDQLPEFNRAELSRLTNDEKSLNNLTEQLRQLVISTVQQNSDNKSISNLQLDDKHIKAVLKWCPPRVTNIQELVKPKLMFLWSQPSLEQINSTINEQQRDTIKHLVNELEMIPDDKYNQSVLNNLLHELSNEHKLQFSKFMKALRLCLTGLTDGPAIGDTMEILGKDSTCTRLKRVYGQEPNGNIFKNHASI